MSKTLQVTVVAVVALFMLALAGPAMANHDHWLELPDGRTQSIAGGQTSQTSGGGCHQFHGHVHKGRMFERTTGVAPGGPSAVTLHGAKNPVPCE